MQPPLIIPKHPWRLTAFYTIQAYGKAREEGGCMTRNLYLEIVSLTLGASGSGKVFMGPIPTCYESHFALCKS